jgi:gamma-glutamyltranspeptidase
MQTLSSVGTSWAIATPHWAATDIGASSFMEGGNALDAALAAAVALAVAYPHNCSVGGDLFALVKRPTGDVIAINASGAAPAALTIDGVGTADGWPERGPFTVTVPGAVGGWQALSAQGARLGFRHGFERAIGLAADGLPVARSLAMAISDERELLLGDPGCASTFYPGGLPLQEDDDLRQPSLARTLGEIANDGLTSIYGGEIGRSWISTLSARGSPMTVDDFEKYQPEVTTPLVGRFRDLDVLVPPPNSQGFVLLQVLATVERLGLDPDPLGLDAPILAQIFQRTSVERARFLADPRMVPVEVDELLSESNLVRLAEDVQRRVGSAGSTGTSRSPSGDTVAMVAADAEGWAVTLIQSLYDSFGSGIMDPGTGVLLHNRGAAFSSNPASPNALAGGKRPMHTLMPVIAMRRDRLVAASGSMGGGGQPQINAMTLLRKFGLGMQTSDVLRAPRWLFGGWGVDAETTTIEVESHVPQETISAFEASDFQIHLLDGLSEKVGHANLITVDNGSFQVASDPRADGSAIAS